MTKPTQASGQDIAGLWRGSRHTAVLPQRSLERKEATPSPCTHEGLNAKRGDDESITAERTSRRPMLPMLVVSVWLP